MPSPRRWTLGLAVLGLAAVAAWVALGSRERAADPARPVGIVPAAVPDARAQPDALPPNPVRTADAPDETPPAASVEVALEPAGDAAVELQFVDPLRRSLLVESGLVRASWAGGAREVSVSSAPSCRFGGLPSGAVTFALEAAGLRHEPQTFALRAGADDAVERLVLWPEGWVAVVVRDERGRPFRALASDRGLDPKRWFVGAFGARTRRAPPTADDEAADPEPPSRFAPPRAWQAYELPGAAVGSLQRDDPAPHWVGPEVFGRLLAWQHLPEGADEVEFRLRASDLDERFAALGLRVVDASAAPIAGARVTLKADTSAHRREDQMRVESGVDGRVEFERVVPGTYELSVETEGALAQERLELAVGERREFGDVLLAEGRPISLRVVDEEGAPLTAWIEVAPLGEGGRAADLYPPNLHRHTGGDGLFELPLPAARSIVRAAGMDPARGHPTGERSYNVLIDPERAPAGEVVLVVTRTRTVEVQARSLLAARVELIDLHGVVVEERELPEGGRARLEVPAGDYMARLHDGEGEVVGLVQVTVRDAVEELHLP